MIFPSPFERHDIEDEKNRLDDTEKNKYWFETVPGAGKPKPPKGEISGPPSSL